MAAVKKIEKQDIIKAAFEILRIDGFEQISVRNIARKLHCSTKPIYFQFENMGELKKELKSLSEKKYIEITEKSKEKFNNNYISHGMAYITFARDEKHLFRYLYLSGRDDKSKLQIDDANYEDIIKAVIIKYNISKEQAKAFHFDMAIYSYGLAVMVNTAFIELSDKKIEERLMTEGLSLKEYYVKNEENK